MADRRVPRAEDRLAPDRRLTVAGLEVREWGPPDGRPLLFVHGLSPTGPEVVGWEAAPRWAGRGFRVIAPALPGFGATPAAAAPDYLTGRLVARLLELADRPVYVGYSWGGMIGVNVPPARLRGLVLLDGGYEDPDEADEPEDDETFASVDEYVELQRPRWRRWTPALEHSLRDALERFEGGWRLRLRPETARAAIAGTAAEPPSAGWPVLAASRLPVLLLAREDADAERLAAFAAAVPQAEIHRLDDAGHNVLADAPERAIDLVGSWADRL